MNASDLRALRDDIRGGLVPFVPGWGACTATSLAVRELTGWDVIVGDYIGDEQAWLHCWNRRPDGWIVDATCDQFGDDAPLVCPPGGPRSERYRELAVLS